MPPSFSDSSLEPTPTQTPRDTDFTEGIRSATTRIPLSRWTFLKEMSFTSVMLGGVADPLLLQGILSAEAYLPLLINLYDLDKDLVSFFEDIRYLFHPEIRKLRDMDKTIGAGKYLDKGPKLYHLSDLPQVDFSDLYLFYDPADHLHRLIGRFFILRGNGNQAGIIDVDLDACLLDDALDHLAAWPDDLPYLGRFDLHGKDPGGVL